MFQHVIQIPRHFFLYTIKTLFFFSQSRIEIKKANNADIKCLFLTFRKILAKYNNQRPRTKTNHLLMNIYRSLVFVHLSKDCSSQYLKHWNGDLSIHRVIVRVMAVMRVLVIVTIGIISIVSNVLVY